MEAISTKRLAYLDRSNTQAKVKQKQAACRETHDQVPGILERCKMTQKLLPHQQNWSFVEVRAYKLTPARQNTQPVPNLT